MDEDNYYCYYYCGCCYCYSLTLESSYLFVMHSLELSFQNYMTPLLVLLYVLYVLLVEAFLMDTTTKKNQNSGVDVADVVAFVVVLVLVNNR